MLERRKEWYGGAKERRKWGGNEKNEDVWGKRKLEISHGKEGKARERVVALIVD